MTFHDTSQGLFENGGEAGVRGRRVETEARETGARRSATPTRRRRKWNGLERKAVEERYAKTERQSTGDGMRIMTEHDIS